MTTSGTYDFSINRDQLIAGALRLAGVIAQGETPSASQVSDAATSLNMMVKAWAADGMPLWAIKETTIPFVAGTNSTTLINYAVPSGFNNTVTYDIVTKQNYINIGGYSAGKFSIDNIAVYPINNDGTPDLTNATPITARNYLDAIVYGDGTGNAEYIEQLPKTQYFDEVKANDYRGRNACTAWVNFDGTTTPPTIRDSYNVASVVRTGTGIYDIYFTIPMDNVNYSTIANSSSGRTSQFVKNYNTFYNKTTIEYQVGGVDYDEASSSVQIFGGKQ